MFKMYDGDTPFHLAAKNAACTVIAVFLRIGTDYEWRFNRNGQSVLDLIDELKPAEKSSVTSEFENIAKIRIAIEAWKKRSTGCINSLPDELCKRFAAFAQDALRRK